LQRGDPITQSLVIGPQFLDLGVKYAERFERFIELLTKRRRATPPVYQPSRAQWWIQTLSARWPPECLPWV